MTDTEIKLTFDNLQATVTGRLDTQDDALRRIEKTVNETKEQAIKTNGSVASIKEWKSFMQGSLAMFTGFITLIVLPILGWALYAIVTLDSHVNSAVNDALKSYNVTQVSE